MANVNFFIIPFLFDLIIASAAMVTNLFGQDLGATPFQLGLIGSAWGAVYSVGALLAGRLADRISPKGLAVGGLLIYFIGILGCSLASAVGHLIALALVLGLGCSLFWPAFETFLHAEGDARETNRRLGLFNIGWTLGVSVGSAIGGALMALGPRLVYRVQGAWILLTCAYLIAALGPNRPARKASAPEHPVLLDSSVPPRPVRLKFLYLSWVAHFTLFFVTGATASMFPKVGRVEGLPDSVIGLVFSLVYFGQGLTFLVLLRTARWHYRVLPILLFEGVTLVGMLFLGLGAGIPLYAAGMLAQGIGRGMSYASSLFYGLSATESKGANAGVHEMLVGSAFTFGPLLAGAVAETVALKASFLACAGVIVVGIGVQVLWLRPHRVKKTG